MPEKEFAFVSPIILKEMEKSINNINDKLTLTQFLNVSGTKVEDLNEIFANIQEQIQKDFSGKLSQQKIDFLKQFLSIIINALSETEGIAKRIIPIAIDKISEDIAIPAYKNLGDIALDIFMPKDIEILPGKYAEIPLGFKVIIPKGYGLIVHPSIDVLRKFHYLEVAPTIIGSNTKEEVSIFIRNAWPISSEGGSLSGSSYTIEKGMKIAQLVL